MKKSNNSEVEVLLTDLEQIDIDKHAIMKKLRELVRKIHPNISERIMYGGIIFSLNEDCGGIFASKHHVSFEFSNGYTMKDPKNVLEGSGKYRRHIKILSIKDIEDKNITYFVKQFLN